MKNLDTKLYYIMFFFGLIALSGSVFTNDQTPDQKCIQFYKSLSDKDKSFYMATPGTFYRLKNIGIVRFVEWKMSNQNTENLTVFYTYQTKDKTKKTVSQSWWDENASCVDNQNW